MIRLLFFLFWIIPFSVTAQSSYPNRAVRVIVPFAPGGASDFVARIMQPRLGELLGQPIVVDNKPGAAGNIGVDAAAKSAPDGYTVFLGNVGSIAINPAVFANLQVNPARDLVAVTQVVDVPSMLIVHPSLPVNTLKELVAYAKANPGKLNYASPGSGSLDRLEMEVLRKLEKRSHYHLRGAFDHLMLAAAGLASAGHVHRLIDDRGEVCDIQHAAWTMADARAYLAALIGELLDAPHGYLLPFEALVKALQGGRPVARFGDPTSGLGYGPIDRGDGLAPPADAAQIARRRLLPLVERMRGDHGFEVGP